MTEETVRPLGSPGDAGRWLGMDRYEPILRDIYEGLGIPRDIYEGWGEALRRAGAPVQRLRGPLLNGASVNESEATPDPSRRELILSSVSDSVVDLLNYDRKEDEELPRGAIEEAVENGEVTIDEMVDLYRKELYEGLGYEDEG